MKPNWYTAVMAGAAISGLVAAHLGGVPEVEKLFMSALSVLAAALFPQLVSKGGAK